MSRSAYAGCPAGLERCLCHARDIPHLPVDEGEKPPYGQEGGPGMRGEGRRNAGSGLTLAPQGVSTEPLDVEEKTIPLDELDAVAEQDELFEPMDEEEAEAEDEVDLD